MKKIVNWMEIAKNIGLTHQVVFIMITLSLFSTAAEVLSIGVFLPIIQFIQLKGDLTSLIASSDIWQNIADWFSYFDIEVSLQNLLLLSFSMLILRQFIIYIRMIYSKVIRHKLTQIQRNNIFNRYIRANTIYHDSTPVGALSNIGNVGVNGAISGLIVPIEIAVNIIIFISYILVLSLLTWEMTLVSVVVLLIATQIPKSWIKKSKIVGREIVSANTAMSIFLISRLKSPSLVRLAGTEEAEKKAFNALTHRQRKHSVTGAILNAKTEVVIEPAVVGLSFIFLYISYNILQLEVGVIAIYLVILMRLLPIVKGITLKWQAMQSLVGSMEAIKEYLHVMQESAEQDTGTKHLNRLRDSILIDNVSYRYSLENSDYALKNINIEFKVNNVTAIVGPSGSGKSTLIDLLPRLRSPVKGVIRIDGKNSDHYTLKSMRELIAYVPQDPQIFDGTAKDHILLGKNNATNKEIQEAARLAGSESFINSLPKGFDTILGEDAVRLSGGQRQRLDLTRALVKKSEVLILDEPTSNLDAESEEAFRKVLYKIRNDMKTTIIIVTHHLVGITDADQIVVLNHGTVESIGVHDSLVKGKGWYSKAWKMQNSS